MKFSVLMSVYNEEKPEYLKSAISSIINQTIKPNQIVIIEDGRLSSELQEIINEYKKKYKYLIDVYSLEENCGLGRALQKGIELCKYEYIARMDTDDVARLDRFEKQIKVLEENPNLDILGGFIQEYDEKMKNKKSIRKVPLSQQESYEKIGKQSPFNHGTVILKKKAVINVGNYRDCKIEDYDLWIRMVLNSCKMKNISEILVNYRTSYTMYKRRTGLKYLKSIKKIEKQLLEKKLITKRQYNKNILLRGILAIIPAFMKIYLYPYMRKKYNI